MQQKYILFFCFLLSTFALNAQIKVSGTVIESDDEPLIGVTIIEKGEVNGTSTDLDGKYELTVKNADAVLIFSYTGFSSSEVPVNGQSLIDVTLEEDVANLDEVIVVGYGTQKKKVVTAAISKVASEDLEDMPVRRIEDALQGRMSGVRVTGGSGNPGDGGTIRIRGTTTLGNSDPLFIVDGVIVGGGIDYLNQGDIESIEVLKDAASAGIYGARAANGVILVTTKGGSNTERTEVNYHSYIGTQAPSRRLAVLNATEYATLLNESWAAAGDTLLFKDPQSLGEGTDWQSAIFNNDAPIQNHDLNFSMGNGKSSYYISFSYLNQKGIISQEKSNYERFTTRLNSSHKLTDNITFGNNIAYTKVKSRGIAANSEFGGPVSVALNIDPITPILETDQDLLDNASWYANENRVTNADSIPYGISNLVTSEVVNPVAALSVGDGFGWSDKIVGNFFTEIKLFNDFKFRSSIGGDLAFWGGEGLNPIYFLNGANFNERNTYSRDKNNGFYQIFENTLSYDKQLGDHKVNVLVGTVAEKNKGEGISGNKIGIPFNTLEEATLSYFVPVEDQNFGGYEYLSTSASILGRLNYNFKEKYLLTALFRRDGSSNFGENNKFGVFPAVSVGWIATDEDFLSQSEVINFLKLRASWGINGNDRIGGNSFISTIGGGRNYSFGQNEILTNGSTPNSLSNPDIRWESTTQTNFGFDAKIFRKIGVTFDVYKQKSEGLLGQIATPWYVGIGGLSGNVGTLENQGADLELSYLGNIRKVKFDISGNISYTENLITNLGPEVEFLSGSRYGPSGLEITRTQVGFPIGSFYGYTTDGLFQNQAEVDAHAFQEEGTAPGDIRFVDINEDGVINEEDRSIIGDPTPTWTFGTNISIEWKSFDLVMFGQGVGGNEVFKATRRFDLPKANMTADALGRWTGEGTSTHYPRLHKNDPNRNFSRSSDFFLENGSFFRIKTLQIGYTLPKIVNDNIRYRDIRLYVSGNNLFTFTKYTGLDPEVNGGSFGIDRGFYPQPRFFLFGINAKF